MLPAPVRVLRDRVLAQNEHETVAELRMCIDATDWDADETLPAAPLLFVTVRDRCCNMPQIRQPLNGTLPWSVDIARVHLVVDEGGETGEYRPLRSFLRRFTAPSCQTEFQSMHGVHLLSPTQGRRELVTMAPLQFCPVSCESGSPHEFTVHTRNASLLPHDTLTLVSRATTGTVSRITRVHDRHRGTELFRRKNCPIPVRYKMPKAPELIVVVQVPLARPTDSPVPLLLRDPRHRIHVTLQIIYPEDHWVFDGGFFRTVDLLFSHLYYKQRRFFPRALEMPSVTSGTHKH